MNADLHIWEAENAPGQPTCVSGNDKEGFSLTLYRDESGAILGGIVVSDDGVVTAFGYVHSGEYLAEVKPE